MSDVPPLTVPDDAIEEKFLAATGPGGQNVNKVATACQLRVDGYKLGLDPESWKRLKVLAGSKMTASGTIVITARRFRTQEANRLDARKRLAELLAAARHRDPRRVKTKPSKAAKAKRVDSKKARSDIKAGRGRVKDF